MEHTDTIIWEVPGGGDYACQEQDQERMAKYNRRGQEAA